MSRCVPSRCSRRRWSRGACRSSAIGSTSSSPGTRRRRRVSSRPGSRAMASACSTRGRRTTRWRTSSSSSRRRAPSPPDGWPHATHPRAGPQGTDPACARPSGAGARARVAAVPHRVPRDVDLADGDRHPDRHPGSRPDAAVATVRGHVPQLAHLPRRHAAAGDVAGDDAGLGRDARGAHHPGAFRAPDPPRAAGRSAGARRRHRRQHRAPHAGRRRRDQPRLRAAARPDGHGRHHPDSDPALVQSRPRSRQVLRSGVPRPRPVHLPDGDRRARNVSRGRAEDDPPGVRLEHLGARVPARKDPGRHGDRARAVPAGRGPHVHALRPSVRRRSHAVRRRQRAVRLLHGGLRVARGRGHPEPGGCRPGRGAGRLPPLVPPLRADLPDREHSRRPAMGLESRPGALLRGDRARRVSAGRRLARRVVGGAGGRRDRPRVLHACLAIHAPPRGEGVRRVWSALFGGRFWALALKELRQIRRDRRLTISLIVPPTLQVLLFGFALDSDVRNLKLGIVDESRTLESRELISVLTQNRTFRLAGTYPTAATLGEALSIGRLDVGVVVPYDFARRRMRGRPATVQVLLNAANANTAQIAQGYVEGAVAFLNRDVNNRDLNGGRAAPVELRTAFLYNPGLVNAWFVVTGVFGTLIILNGSLVSAATMIREKERGTVEQLLMTPASALEVVTAKIVPLFVLLMAMVALVLAVARLVFGVPLRGNPALVLVACACCVLTGIGLGTLISTFVRSASQAQLISFFINPPLAMLSGGLTPIEAMPKWVQPLTLFNPIAHFATIARSVLIKGAGLDVVYPNLLALIALASLFVGISAWRFRRQLS